MRTSPFFLPTVALLFALVLLTGCAGIINGKFVFCLPGSNGAVRDGWTKVIAPQLDHRTHPCNLVEIMPRLMER